jgi:hypothetical protein
MLARYEPSSWMTYLDLVSNTNTHAARTGTGTHEAMHLE